MGAEITHSTCSVIDGSSNTRTDAVGKCERCAKLKGHKYFALQNGGACFSSSTASYDAEGPSTNCIDDGKGGRWANFVYKRKCK